MDCSFGPNTEYATRNWQARHQLTADGIVGRNTFSRADDKLQRDPDGRSVYYNGRAHRIYLGTRLAFPGTGWYAIDVPWGQGAWFHATYSPPIQPAPLQPPACWG
jgi:peptidoglycan hydrolase-like protein with peptidoglycan-binding domain